MKNMGRRGLHGLYVLTDEHLGERLQTAVAAALAGGARLVQYRDKGADAVRHESEARGLRVLTRAHNARLIVNDDPASAAAAEADGVHLGKDDPDIVEARRLLGDEAIIGVSCYDSLQLARDAVAAGADYVAFGSIYPSPTKPDAMHAPLELLAAAKRELAVPICAIGGITLDNAAPVLAAGADILAVISSVFSAPDIERATREFIARHGL
ncbi:MAG: thiamine phosphate synthase [Gammaproteobacteria bacterium]